MRALSSIQVKLLLAGLGPLLLGGALLSGIFAWLTERRVETRMAQSQVQYQEFYQQALAYALWEYDTQAMRNIADSVAVLRDVAGVAVATDGQRLIQAGRMGEAAPAKAVTRTSAITYDTQDETHRLGELTLVFDRSAIQERIRDQVLRDTGLIGLLLAAIGVSLWWAQRRLVVRPLSSFQQAFEASRAHGGLRPVAKTADDEIGAVADAYNVMVKRVRAEEAALRQAKEEAEKAQAEAERANRTIRESLETAQRVQRAALSRPEPDALGLRDMAVWWQPRDQVGGDFYRVTQSADGRYVALLLIDCTGHGVPGALISFAATAAVDRTLRVESDWRPDRILYDLDGQVRDHLHGGDESPDVDDGLEAGLLVIDTHALTGRFAGVGLDLILERGGEVSVVRGRRGGLGYRSLAPPPRRLPVAELGSLAGCDVFLATDGILEQTGGPHGVQLGRSRFARLIADTAGSDALGPRLARLQTSFAAWRGNHPQRDDVTLVAVRPG